MSAGYAITNALSALAATAFTWSSAYTTGRARLNDTIQDELAASAATAQASGQTLAIDFGAATALVGFALLNHNLSTGACAVLVEADAGPTFATAVVAKAATTINTTAPYQKDTVLQFPSVSKRYWRFTFTHTGSKLITIGEVLALAAITTLSRDSVYGSSGNSERYVLNRNEGQTGHVRSTFVGGPIRTKRLAFKNLRDTQGELDEVMGMWRATQGGNKNLLFLDTISSSATAGSSDSQKCIWGKLQAELGNTEEDFRLYDIDGLSIVGQGREVGS